MSGHFNLERKTDYFRLESLELSGNDAVLNLQGIYQSLGRFNGTIQLDNLDISQWIMKERKTNLSGYILLDGDFRENQITELDINAEISESILFDQQPSC